MDHHLPRAVTPRVAPKHTGVVRSVMLGFERVGGTVGGAYVGVMAIAELLRAPAAVHSPACDGLPMVRVTENLTRVMGE